MDTSKNAVMAATLDGTKWTSTVVATGVSGDGLDMAVDADGIAHLTFYDGQGGVKLATQGDLGWDVTDVADTDVPAMGPEELPILEPMTGVAVDGDGMLYVTYTDQGTREPASSADGGDFERSRRAGPSKGSCHRRRHTRRQPRLARLVRHDQPGPAVRRLRTRPGLDHKLPSPTPAARTAPAGFRATGHVVKPGRRRLDVAARSASPSSRLPRGAGRGQVHHQFRQPGRRAVPHNADFYTEAPTGGKSYSSSGDPSAGTRTAEEPQRGSAEGGDVLLPVRRAPTNMNGTFLVVRASKK